MNSSSSSSRIIVNFSAGPLSLYLSLLCTRAQYNFDYVHVVAVSKPNGMTAAADEGATSERGERGRVSVRGLENSA